MPGLGSFVQDRTAPSRVRAVPSTRAPRNDKIRHASAPRPEVQPVTRMVFPCRDNPSVTCSAVEACPNPVGPLDEKMVNSDMKEFLFRSMRDGMLAGSWLLFEEFFSF